MLDRPNSVHTADCSELSPCWRLHQLQRSAHRLSILSNVCICKYKHNDKVTLQPYTDTCTSCSRQTATFRHVNMLNYCTFLQFLSTRHHPDCGNTIGSTTLWQSWKVDEFHVDSAWAVKLELQWRRKDVSSCSDPISSSNPPSVILSQLDTPSSCSLQHTSNMTCQRTENDSLITAALLVYW
jgi:hypothetical protein